MFIIHYLEGNENTITIQSIHAIASLVFPLLSSGCPSVCTYAVQTHTCGALVLIIICLKIVQLTNFLVFNFLGLFIYFVGE